MRTVAAIAASTLATVCLLAFREKPLIPAPVDALTDDAAPRDAADEIDRTDAMVEPATVGGFSTPDISESAETPTGAPH